MSKKAIILDRDGTIIIDKVYLNDVSKIEYMTQVFEGLKKMKDMGFDFVVATNQSGVARGIVSLENLDLIHQKIQSDLLERGLEIQKFYFAPYSVESNHPMRKPNPGMLLTAQQELGLDLKQCFMIGDRDTDILAGQAAGCKAIYLDHSFALPAGIKPDYVCSNLMQAADWIETQL